MKWWAILALVAAFTLILLVLGFFAYLLAYLPLRYAWRRSSRAIERSHSRNVYKVHRDSKD